MKSRAQQMGKRQYALIMMFLGLFLVGACDLTDPVTVTITSPKEGDAFAVGESITFSGTAVDAKEGELTGDALVWEAYNDEDVQIGTGNSFTRSDLAEGFYLIFLTATNSTGEIGMADVSIEVGDPFSEDNETDNETYA